MYLVSIAPIYSQGVGNFELITDNIENIKKFRNELYRYKNYLVSLDSSDMDSWEFYEYIYKLVNYKPNKYYFNGYCVWEHCYAGKFSKLKNFANINLNKNNTKIENFETSMQLNYVYNNFDDNMEPIYIDNFDIIGKNYLK